MLCWQYQNDYVYYGSLNHMILLLANINSYSASASQSQCIAKLKFSGWIQAYNTIGVQRWISLWTIIMIVGMHFQLAQLLM